MNRPGGALERTSIRSPRRPNPPGCARPSQLDRTPGKCGNNSIREGSKLRFHRRLAHRRFPDTPASLASVPAGAFQTPRATSVREYKPATTPQGAKVRNWKSLERIGQFESGKIGRAISIVNRQTGRYPIDTRCDIANVRWRIHQQEGATLLTVSHGGTEYGIGVQTRVEFFQVAGQCSCGVWNAKNIKQVDFL